MPPRDGADEVRSHNENPEQTAAFPDQISPMAPMPPMPARMRSPIWSSKMVICPQPLANFVTCLPRPATCSTVTGQ